MDTSISHFLVWWQPLGYLLVFIGLIFEGELFLFTAAFLTHQGFFDPAYMLIAVFSGVFVGDAMWFAIGAKLNGRFPRFTKIIERMAQPFDDHIINRPRRTIFLSKFTYGLHHAMLVRAGSLNLDWEEFLKDDVAVTIFWVLIVGGLGFLSSASYDIIKHRLHSLGITLVIGLLIFILLWHLIAHGSKKRL